MQYPHVLIYWLYNVAANDVFDGHHAENHARTIPVYIFLFINIWSPVLIPIYIYSNLDTTWLCL
jgi:hypothetical protein